MNTLTKYQKETLNYIKEYSDKNNYSPTFEEIQKKFKLKTISSAWFRVKHLQEKGYIEKEKYTPRTLKIINNVENEIIDFVKNFSPKIYNVKKYKELVKVLKEFQLKIK